MINRFKIKKIKNTKFVIIFGVLLLIILAAATYRLNRIRLEPKKIYNVVVMVRSQNNSDHEEDKRTSLKTGDVLMVKEDGHKWSSTENVSYLILKMNLTEEQAQKIIEPVEVKLSKDEINKEMEQFKQDRQDIPEEELNAHEEELEQRKEVVLLRKYKIDMSEFKDFQPNDLLNGQPYQNEIYDWSIVEKK